MARRSRRYMATNDLCTELQKDIKVDASMERRCVRAAFGPEFKSRARARRARADRRRAPRAPPSRLFVIPPRARTPRRICAAVLKQLDDSSNDVQSIAVKCLGVLLGKVQEAQVGEICDKLCTLVLEGKDELRDIYSIGLKTVSYTHLTLPTILLV